MSKKIEMPKITKSQKSVKGRELVYQGNPTRMERDCLLWDLWR